MFGSMQVSVAQAAQQFLWLELSYNAIVQQLNQTW